MSSYTAKKPKFFKIILETTIRQRRLGIPTKFVRNYGNCLSSPVILKIPTGLTWKVELLKNGDDEVWLEKGWQEFAEYHSLKHGNLLLFKYEGNCQFRVLIFDMSAVEIEYSTNSDIHLGEKTDNMQENKDDPMTKAKCPSMQENKDDPMTKAKCPSMQENKDDPMTKTKCPSVVSTPPNGNQSKVIKIEVDSDCSSQESGGKFSKSMSDESKRSSQSSISQAEEAANKFISTLSHPCFMVVLSSSRHGNLYQQSIPIAFIRKHMECKTQKVTLKVADKQWPVKMNVYLSRSSARFSVGWSTFARENSLKKRDVCVFERIKRNMLSVSIFRCVPVH